MASGRQNSGWCRWPQKPLRCHQHTLQDYVAGTNRVNTLWHFNVMKAGQSDRSDYGRYRDRDTTHNTRVSQHLDTYAHAYVHTITQSTRSSHHSVTIVTRQLHTPAWHSYSKPPHTYTYNIHTRTLFTDCATQTPTSLTRLHTRHDVAESRNQATKGDRLNGSGWWQLTPCRQRWT